MKIFIEKDLRIDSKGNYSQMIYSWHFGRKVWTSVVPTGRDVKEDLAKAFPKKKVKQEEKKPKTD